MDGIPAGPIGQEKFTVTFDLDADSILKVTAKNKSTGKTQDITIDAKAGGRLTADEVNKLIEKAEEMKISDYREEKIAQARGRLDSLCSSIRLKSQTYPPEKINFLQAKVNSCVERLKGCQDEAQIESEYTTLVNEAVKIFTDIKEEARRDAMHLNNLSRLTATHYLQEGWNRVDKGTISDLHEALDLFNRAYFSGQHSKRPRIHMTEANIGYGHVVRKLLEQERDKRKTLDLCIQGVLTLSMGMEFDREKILSKEARDEANRDFEAISQKFFCYVTEVDKKEAWGYVQGFLRAVENDATVKNTRWRQHVFFYSKKAVRSSIALLSGKIEEEDFASALHMVSELNCPKIQLERLVDGKSKQEVDRILADLNTQEFIAKGMKELFHAQEAVNGSHGQLDLALLALDHVNEAKVLTKNRHSKTYWRAKLYEGNIFQQQFQNRTKAKSCFTEILESSDAKKIAEVCEEAKLNLKRLEAAEAEQSKTKFVKFEVNQRRVG